MSSCGAMAQSATSTQPNSCSLRPIRARTRATWISSGRCGTSSISRRKGAAKTGIRSSTTATSSPSMTIDWAHFTPWSSFAGGLLIGAAVAAFVLMHGRVAGISGIIGGLLRPAGADVGWRLAFLGGLLFAPVFYALFVRFPLATIEASFPAVILAGVLVGIGTRYGSGCTRGHGVCGISRLSPRSLVATATFMGAGIVTVFVVRHVLA